MAELVTIARPYAEAAFKLALEGADLQRWSEMLSLLEMVATDEGVKRVIGDPNVDGRALEGLILGGLGERLDGHGRNLVQLLIENGRLDLVPEMREQYEALRRNHEGVLEARIISAMPLDGAQVDGLRGALEKKYSRRVNTQIEVDAHLIGGVRIVVGDKVIDATVRGRLDAMAAALAR